MLVWACCWVCAAWFVRDGLVRQMLAQAIQLFTKFAIIGGGIYCVWGIITLAGGLKDHNGGQQQSGMWQAIGGGMIIAAASLFAQVQL